MYVILPGMCRPRGPRQFFLSSEEVDRICMFVASLCYSVLALCYSALVYSTSSQVTSSVSVVAPLDGSEGCGESRPEDSSTRHELQAGPSMVGRKQQAFFTRPPGRRPAARPLGRPTAHPAGSPAARSSGSPATRLHGRQAVVRPPAPRPPSHCYTTFFTISRQ